MLITFSFEGKYGFADSNLQIVIEPQFPVIPLGKIPHFTEEGFAIVSFGPGAARVAIIDVTGNEILTLERGLINRVYRDLFHLSVFYLNDSRRMDSKIVRLSDNKIIASSLASSVTYPSGDRYIMVRFLGENRYTFIDSDGNRVLQHLLIERDSNPFFEQRAVIYTDEWEELLIIDMEGNTVGNLSFRFLGTGFSEGLLPAMTEDGTTGFVNRSGEFAFKIPLLNIYHELGATSFSGGYAAKKTNVSPIVWRVINNHGQVVSGDIHAFEMRPFFDGLSLVRVFNRETQENRWGYVNARGEFLVRPVLEAADDFRNGFARIKYNGREGLLNTNGKVIWSSNIVQNIIIEEDLW